MKTRVWQFDEVGGPEKLVLREREQRAPGPGEVLVRVQSLSLNRADALWLANTYTESPKPPSGIGYEVAGIVEAVGSGAAKFLPGDPVSNLPNTSLSEYTNFGETTVLPERALMKTPHSLSAIDASCFSFAYMTDYFGLVELAGLQTGQVVVITAATSTTGLAAIRIAKRLGATVIATTRTPKKRSILLDSGADHVVTTGGSNVTETILELTSGRGADVVYDCIVGDLLERLANATRVRGRYIAYGLLGGPGAFPWFVAFGRGLQFDVHSVFNYTGNASRGIPANEPAVSRALEFIATGLTEGSLDRVPIDRVFDGLEKVPEAIQYMLANSASGKIVVTV